MLHRVKDLSPEQRLAIESLLGRRISEDEAVSVKTMAVSSVLPADASDERKEAAFERLRQYFAAVDTQKEQMSSDESASLLEEAIRSARPGYRRAK